MSIDAVTITEFNKKHKKYIIMGNVLESMKDNDVNTLLGEVIESTTGYSCPNCGAICSDKTLISRTDFEFEDYPGPHYSWDETHKCQKCETLYLLHNGT